MAVVKTLMFFVTGFTMIQGAFDPAVRMPLGRLYPNENSQCGFSFILEKLTLPKRYPAGNSWNVTNMTLPFGTVAIEESYVKKPEEHVFYLTTVNKTKFYDTEGKVRCFPSSYPPTKGTVKPDVVEGMCPTLVPGSSHGIVVPVVTPCFILGLLQSNQSVMYIFSGMPDGASDCAKGKSAKPMPDNSIGSCRLPFCPNGVVGRVWSKDVLLGNVSTTTFYTGGTVNEYGDGAVVGGAPPYLVYSERGNSTAHLTQKAKTLGQKNGNCQVCSTGGEGCFVPIMNANHSTKWTWLWPLTIRKGDSWCLRDNVLGPLAAAPWFEVFYKKKPQCPPGLILSPTRPVQIGLTPRGTYNQAEDGQINIFKINQLCHSTNCYVTSYSCTTKANCLPCGKKGSTDTVACALGKATGVHTRALTTYTGLVNVTFSIEYELMEMASTHDDAPLLQASSGCFTSGFHLRTNAIRGHYLPKDCTLELAAGVDTEHGFCCRKCGWIEFSEICLSLKYHCEVGESS